MGLLTPIRFLSPCVGSARIGMATVGMATVGMILCCPLASAQVVTVTSTTSGGWHTDTEYGDLFEKLNVSGGVSAWRAGIRLDTALFFSPPAPEIANVYTLEKAWGSYTGRHLEVQVGDAYVSIGRGLALSLRKVDELGLDTTLRGARALAHSDRLEGLLAVGLANINNVDEATGSSHPDPHDILGGAQIRWRASDRVTLGAYGTAAAFRESLGLVESAPFANRVLHLGGMIDAPRLTDWLGFYGEGMVQRAALDPEPADPRALALYSALTGYFGPTTMLVEAKAYGPLTPLTPRLEGPFATVTYNAPPTAERVLQVLENPQRNVAGARARGDWVVGHNLNMYVNDGVFLDKEGYADPSAVGEIRPGWIHDPYGGIEVRWNESRSHAGLSGGYRSVFLEESGDKVRGDGHVELDATQDLTGAVSVTLHATHLQKYKVTSELSEPSHLEGSLEAGLRVRPWIAAAIGWDYTTDPTQPKRDYFYGTLAWDITPSSSLRLLLGSQRGGLKCASGVCRVFPPFEGARMTATLRF